MGESQTAGLIDGSVRIPLIISEGYKKPDVFDDIIDRQGSSVDAARIAAVIASDFRFAYFCTAAFAVRLLRQSKAHRWHPDESPAHGERAQHQARAAA
jgi:hypothetical protein